MLLRTLLYVYDTHMVSLQIFLNSDAGEFSSELVKLVSRLPASWARPGTEQERTRASVKRDYLVATCLVFSDEGSLWL